MDKSSAIYKNALKYESASYKKAVDEVNKKLLNATTKAEADAAVSSMINDYKNINSQFNIDEALIMKAIPKHSDKVYKNYPTLKLNPKLSKDKLKYLGDVEEQQVRLVRAGEYFKKTYGWDGTKAGMTDDMLETFTNHMSKGTGSIPHDVRGLVEASTNTASEFRNVLSKAWGLTPVGLGGYLTDTKQTGGFNLGAEISPEIGLGKFCGSLTGCGKGASPFSIRPSVEASYNTGSKNISTGYGGGIGAYIGSSGLESSLSYKKRNAFKLSTSPQGDDITSIGKGTNNLSLSLGMEGGGKGMRSVSDSAPYRYGVNTEYDLTNNKLSNIGLYGQYGKFKGSLGYNPTTKGVSVGAGFKFQKGGFEYETGGVNEFATSYPKKKEIIDTSYLGAIQEFGDNISTIFKPKTYKKGPLTLKGKLNEPQINLGWNKGPTIGKPSYSGNISADLKLRKGLSLYGNVDYLSNAQPEYKAGLKFRFKRGGYKYENGGTETEEKPVNYRQHMMNYLNSARDTNQVNMVMNTIAEHESFQDADAIQLSGDKETGFYDGPGRGLFQFENLPSGGGNTAMNRNANFLKHNTDKELKDFPNLYNLAKNTKGASEGKNVLNEYTKDGKIYTGSGAVTKRVMNLTKEEIEVERKKWKERTKNMFNE